MQLATGKDPCLVEVGHPPIAVALLSVRVSEGASPGHSRRGAEACDLCHILCYEKTRKKQLLMRKAHSIAQDFSMYTVFFG